MRVFTIIKPRKHKDRARNQWPWIPPAMLAMRRKQECIPSFQQVDLILNLIFQLPAET